MKKQLNGAELVIKIILNTKENPIEKLFEIAGVNENEWLELKASILPTEEDKKKGTEKKDIIWNIAKAIIAIGNRNGGVVIIGIKDDGNALGLEQSDEKKDSEEKTSEDKLQIKTLESLEKLSWDTKSGTYTITSELKIRPEIKEYQGKKVLLLIVDPFEKIVTVEVKDKQGRQLAPILYARKEGTCGNNAPITSIEKIIEYKEAIPKERESSYKKYYKLWAKHFPEEAKNEEDEQKEQKLKEKEHAFPEIDDIDFNKKPNWILRVSVFIVIILIAVGGYFYLEYQKNKKAEYEEIKKAEEAEAKRKAFCDNITTEERESMSLKKLKKYIKTASDCPEKVEVFQKEYKRLKKDCANINLKDQKEVNKAISAGLKEKCDEQE